MKLSEAILLSIGAVSNDPSIWLFVDGRYACGCAIGTALYSVGFKSVRDQKHQSGVKTCIDVWPWTGGEFEPDISIADELSHRHLCGQSRETLAEWIASLEDRLNIADGQASAQSLEYQKVKA